MCFKILSPDNFNFIISGVLLLLICIHCDCSTIKTCSFESQSEKFIDSKCMIQPDRKDTWSVSSSSKNKFIPSFKGNFALLEKAQVDVNPLISSLLLKQSSTQPFGCFSFWYYSPVDGNEIQIEINGIAHDKRVRTHSSNKYWTFFEAGFSSNVTKLGISLTAGVKDKYVAIDEIKLDEDPCNGMAQICIFSYDSCSFHSPEESKWKISSNKTFSKHSFVATDFDGTKSKSELVSSVYLPTKTGTACIDFKYLFTHSPKSDHSKLDVYLTDLIDGTTKSLLSLTRRPSQSSFFERKVLQASGLSKEWRITFVSDPLSAGSEHVALTDVSINPNNCPIELDCNFESDTCLWEILYEKEEDISGRWKRKTQESFLQFNSTVLMLPEKDITLNSSAGSYLYVSNVFSTSHSHHKIRSQKVALPSLPGCLSFWVFTNSVKKVDSFLQVTFTTENKKSRLVSMPSESTVARWKNIFHDITSEKDFLGYFEISYFSDETNTSIAIDDIRLDMKKCQPSDFEQQPPNIVTDGSVLACDFDNYDTCQYVVPKPFEGNHFNWKLVSDYPGPGCDSKEVHQEFLVSSHLSGLPAAPRTYTELLSPLVTASKFCLFSFNKSSQDDFALSVTIQGNDSYEIWFDEQFNAQFENWTQVEVVLNPVDEPFRLNFSSQRREGFIAIDQLRLETCQRTSKAEKRENTCTFELDSNDECKKQWSHVNASSTRRLLRDGPTRDADLSRSGKITLLRGHGMESNPFEAKEQCSLRFQWMTFNSSIEILLNNQESSKNESLGILKTVPGDFSFKNFTKTFLGPSIPSVLTLTIKHLLLDGDGNSFSAIDNSYFSPKCLFLTASVPAASPKRGWILPFFLILTSLVIFLSLAYFGYRKKQLNDRSPDRQALHISYSELNNL